MMRSIFFVPLFLLLVSPTEQQLVQIFELVGDVANSVLRTTLMADDDSPDVVRMHPDVGRPTPDMIVRQGYKAETHQVTTEDGYVLQMHRIPSNSPGGEPVFLQHGLLSSSADWVELGPESGLAYILNEQGYDVWMGNARGNTYSRNHVSLSPASSKFWQYTFNECGMFDLPAEIDYVLETTNYTQLTYIGHSMGTTMFWVLASTRPEYNAKIKQMHALSPVAFMKNVKTPIRLITPFASIGGWFTSMIGVNEFAPSNFFTEYIGRRLCRDGAVTQSVCSNITFLLFGFNSRQLNETALPVIYSHTPAGVSTKTLLHFSQLINSDRFCKYDHGSKANMQEYKTAYPPDYQLERITAPVYLHYSSNDWMSELIDVVKLCKSLKNCRGMYKVPLEEFNHLDFLWAIDVRHLLYNRVLRQMTWE
ncbi:lipase 3-like [Neocloeon triangulifer]|uniref:lipase 3-like n=1 Tax=Neocloeon triangulifer TaxID=2078957 RepID=UPI00286EE2DD|nr:lipase 3-like [Neocloeon triangulifer]